MNDLKINIINNDTIELFGYINFENIVKVLEQCTTQTKNVKNIIVDLKNLQNSNSCVLLFIINYMRHSIKNQQKIKFINIPTLLIELSKVYNLNKIINNG